MIKNIPTLCVVCALLAPAAYAQSTCETRVDRNLDKSTQQKVEYCLTPEPEKVPNEPRVVYFSSYYVSSPKPKDKVKIPRYIKQPGKKYKEEPLSRNREYWEAVVYPLFENDTLSSQDERDVNAAVLELFPGSTFQMPPTGSARTIIVMRRKGEPGQYEGPVTVKYDGKEVTLTDKGDGTFEIPGTEEENDGVPLSGYFAYEASPKAAKRESAPAYQPSVRLGSSAGNPYFPANQQAK